MSEARASLLSGDVVELINASVVDSTSMKLSWQVGIFFLYPYFSFFIISLIVIYFYSLKLFLNFFLISCVFSFLFYLQIINGKYVEGFYIYARQLLDTSTGSSSNTNPLVAAARSSSSSSNTRSTAASSSALISASKPNIARRDGTPYVLTSTTTPSTLLQSAASYVGSAIYLLLYHYMFISRKYRKIYYCKMLEKKLYK